MTLKQYEQLRNRGIGILEKLMPELNKISNQFIRQDKKSYRTEEEFKELTIALALYDESIDGLLV